MLSADEFVSLANFLRPVEHPAQSSREDKGADAGTTTPQREQTSDELAETLAAVRCFRAALADALDVAVQNLLPIIARDVLARELRIERANLAAIVAEAVAHFGREHVLAVRVCSDEVGALALTGIEVVADDRLSCGDIAIELHTGTIDMSLRARLDALLKDSAR